MIEVLSVPAGPGDQQQAGSVLTVVKADEVIVWLIGDIGPSAGPQLESVAARAPRVTRWLTIDGSRVTSGELTLVRFLAAVSSSMHVSVRRPSRTMAELIAVSGLSRRMLVEAIAD